VKNGSGKTIGTSANIGGICNISDHGSDQIIAFDVCPANRVLNALAQEVGLPFDNSGTMAATGKIHTELLEALQGLSYYQQPPPKSLANEFGLHEVLPLLHSFQLPIADKMATMVEHIAAQVARCITPSEPSTMVATGGGVHHQLLQQRLQQKLSEKQVELIIPDTLTIDYKEALVMAFIAILRWREEVNVLQSVTGARRSSVGGALWMGQL
jgi:anhydro-N-acetylmuramic acid kinase